MSDIAFLIGRNDQVKIHVWRQRNNLEKKPEVDKEEINSDEKERRHVGILALEGPLPEVAIKLSSAVSGVVRALECPICLESAQTPVSQCVNGHILCVGCRAKSTRCPVCRVSLGQGRCLLADKCHKVLVESFGIDNNKKNSLINKSESLSLSKRLFGSTRKPIHHQKEKINFNKHRSPHRAKNLISRIFPSISLDDENNKAISTESLPATTQCCDDNENGRSTRYIGRQWLLPRNFNNYLNDRTKSASTGELSRENNRTNSGSLNRLTNNDRDDDDDDDDDETRNCDNGLLSVPPTPIWGGSTESVANFRINCPLFKSEECRELLTRDTILEHLAASHRGPMIHFHNGKANLPIPWPFHSQGIYILHRDEDVFFLQSENESIWILGSNTNDNKWHWTLNILDDQEDVKFRRDVISLQETFNNTSSSTNVVILPENCTFKSVEIHILESENNEDIEV
ncbi:uncharacterized protein LOC127282511 isoform X2 [Leptopilina boulardi]|nr:uncharacterized protein LOC127282511 isoform X2 [Leptopilina boulardi]XP_051162741.1 uncharacterized protein LOC127282511 isoform X2 [Leptopilina boulardi]